MGLPSPLVEWCDAVIARLVEFSLGPVDIVSANTLEELGLALIKSSTSHFIVASRVPSDGLRNVLTEHNTRYVVALDDPRAAFQNLVTKHGLDTIAATRAVAGSCASLLNYTMTEDALVLRAEREGRDPLGTAQTIARHFALDVAPADIAQIVVGLADISLTSAPSDIDTWWSDLEEPKRVIAVSALDGYVEHFAGRGLGKLIWSRDLFFVGDDPRQPADRPIDITGRIRNLVFGPYIILPPGSWVATVVLGFSREAAEVSYAIEFIAARLEERPLTLVPTGPLTNVALLLALHPDARPERIVLMGGAIAEGNVTPAAEFNIWCDPEAAARVFASGIDVTMIGLDVTHKALFGDRHKAQLEGEVGEMVRELLAFYGSFHKEAYGWDGSPIHDAVAVAHVLRPDLVRTAERGVVVDCGGELSRGRTYVDLWGRAGWEANCHVAVDVDADAFLELLVERISALG